MFEYKTLKELSDLPIEDQQQYQIDKAEHEAKLRKDELTKAIEDAQKNNASKEDIGKLQGTLKAVTDELEKAMMQLKSIGEKGNASGEKEGLRKYIQENSEVLKGIMANKSNAKQLDITLKSTQGATDIGQRDDYAQFLPGTERKPVRRTAILDLFRRKPVSREYIKYREENVVTRNAKFVVACATSTHTTKKTWVNRTVELAKVRDIVDICIDMLDDYDFVEAEIRELVNESIYLAVDYELLLGASATATDMLSIDFISSEFDPANALADFSAATGTPFQMANIEQLASAMSAQINVFGQENKWMPDTIILNYVDYTVYKNLKNLNGDKVILTLSDGTNTIAGLRVVTSPIVARNTCYVFDSMQGEILDRQMLTVKTSFENNDNIEHEMVTLVGVARLQFNVKIINRNAFMKCSDIATAITAITAP